MPFLVEAGVLLDLFTGVFVMGIIIHHISREFTSITRTADELSIVCLAGNVPQDVPSGPRWMCLKLEGPFLFSQTGVLLSFIQPLSGNGVPIFAVCTYDTDYILIQEEHMGGVVELLRQAGHELVS